MLVLREDALEGVDGLEAPAPHVLGDQSVDAHDEDVLVVGAVEDADHPLLGDIAVDAPQEVVRLLQRSGLLEGGDPAPLRVDAVHHLLDRAVLATGVHPLHHEQDGVALRGVAQLLQLAQLRLQRPQLRLPLLAPDAVRVAGVEVPGMGGLPDPASRRIPFRGGPTRRPGKQRTIDGHAMTHNMRATFRGGPCGAPGG